MANAKRIVICNGFSDNNRGGAAITAATIKAAQAAYPGCNLSLITVGERGDDNFRSSHRHTLARYPEVEILPPPVPLRRGRFAGLRAIVASLRWLLRLPGSPMPVALQRILNADLVISKGGYVFVDRRRLRRVFSLWITAFPIIFANRCGVPTVVFSSTVGPFKGRIARWCVGWILKRTTLILPRDPRSYEEALSLGIEPRKVIQVPDSVFLNTGTEGSDTNHLDIDHLMGQYRLDGARFAVVTVRRIRSNPSLNEELLNNLAAVSRQLLERGIIERIAVVVQVDGPGESDKRASEELVNRVHDPRVLLVNEDMGPRDLIALYGRAEFTLACRLHCALFSLLGGTPAIPISIDGKKTEGLFEGMGLAHLVVPVKDVSAATVIATVEDILRQRPEIHARIASAVQAAQHEAYAMVDMLRRLDNRRIA